MLERRAAMEDRLIQVGDEVIYEGRTWIIKFVSGSGRMATTYCPGTGETLTSVFSDRINYTLNGCAMLIPG